MPGTTWMKQPWSCNLCQERSSVKFLEGEDALSVVHRIEDDHEKVSPGCKAFIYRDILVYSSEEVSA